MMTTLPQFAAAKGRGDKIAFVTCYDSLTARLVAASGIDGVLVGDSVAMTVHGHRDTVAADLDMMTLHVSAVRRGLGQDGFMVAAVARHSCAPSNACCAQAPTRSNSRASTASSPTSATS
jgi:ketopantoate hydroxymethyltransferase